MNIEATVGAEAEIILRTMSPDDVAAVSSLHLSLDPHGWNTQQWAQALEYYPCAWVLQCQHQIVGYAIYQTRVPQTELLNIGVAAGHQGQGLAANLLQSTIKLLPESADSLYLEVRHSNIPAIGLYEKTGFEKVGLRPDYYPVAGGAREDALIYKYELVDT